jgi:5-methylcytosine-specific restriction endonuclease McrA
VTGNVCNCGVQPGERHARHCQRKRHNVRKRIRPATRAAVFARDGHRCRRCGSQDDLSIDHIVSLVDGGTNRFRNLQTLCRACNVEKG